MNPITVHRIYQQDQTGPTLVQEDRTNGRQYMQIVARNLRAQQPNEAFRLTEEAEIDIGGVCPECGAKFIMDLDLAEHARTHGAPNEKAFNAGANHFDFSQNAGGS